MTFPWRSFKCLHFAERKLTAKWNILSQSHIPDNTGARFLVQACWLQSCDSLISLHELPKKELKKKKANNMLGLFLLMKMSATSCHESESLWTDLLQGGISNANAASQAELPQESTTALWDVFHHSTLQNGESWRKYCFSCCLSNSRITWNLGTECVFPGVTDTLEHSSNTSPLLPVYKGGASSEKMFSTKAWSIFLKKSHTTLWKPWLWSQAVPSQGSQLHHQLQGFLRSAIETLATEKSSKTMLLPLWRSINESD